MSYTVTFDDVVVVDPDTGFEATDATILEIRDQPSLQRLDVVLQFEVYPSVVKRLTLYEGQEYTDLGDWTYDTLLERIKTYYQNGRSFPWAPSPEELASTDPPEPAPPSGG